ncbi:MAG TPA: serine/threonine-protein kinase, partial [Gemmataceae bacterium]|nr:serine/threonine-protein kinase [Gemmataceae bacterium]
SDHSPLTTHHSPLTPKITDFGLAKLLEDEPAHSIPGKPTKSGAVLGTPSYMAPEQAAGQTRQTGPAVDVYALGAILYELLTARPPFRADTTLKTLLQVQSVEPVPPSRLCPRLPRDLATICLKCLEKSPAKRYATAEALADDLARFLAGEPICARPIGALERTWRWCRRKPVVASLAGALGVIVIGSLVGLTALYLDADSQRRRAEGAETSLRNAVTEAQEGETKARQSEAQTKTVLKFVEKRILSAARPRGQQGGLGRGASIRAAVQQAEPTIAKAFAGQPLAEASIRQTLGHSYWFWSDYSEAIRQHQRALELRRAHLGPDDPETLKSMVSLAQDYEAAGQHEEALKLDKQTYELLTVKSGPNDTETLWALKGVADALRSAGRLAEAIPLYEQVFRRAKAALGPDHSDTLIYMANLANAYRLAGRFSESIPVFEDALKRQRANPALGPNHPDTLVTMNDLAMAYDAAGRGDDAEALYREALERMQKVLGPSHRETLNTMANLGTVYRERGRLDKALPLLEKSLQGKTAALGPEHFLTLISMGHLAAAYSDAGRFREALPLFAQAMRVLKETHEAAYPYRLDIMNKAGVCLIRMKEFGKAEPLLRECLALRLRQGADEWEVYETKSQFGQALAGLKRYAEAEPLLREAYTGLMTRKSQIPAPLRRCIPETAQALVDLYKAQGKSAQVTAWQQKLASPNQPQP